jgi:hypothetical protein
METRQIRFVAGRPCYSNLLEKIPLRSVRHLFRRDDFLR